MLYIYIYIYLYTHTHIYNIRGVDFVGVTAASGSSVTSYPTCGQLGNQTVR